MAEIIWRASFPGPCKEKGPGNMQLKLNYTSSTVIAPASQTSIQLSQPKHSSAFTGTDLSSCISNTSTGQTSTHSSQPSHFSSSTVGIKAILKASFHNKIKSRYQNRPYFRYRAKSIYQLINGVKHSCIFFYAIKKDHFLQIIQRVSI
jgi:hypothetical protein